MKKKKKFIGITKILVSTLLFSGHSMDSQAMESNTINQIETGNYTQNEQNQSTLRSRLLGATQWTYDHALESTGAIIETSIGVASHQIEGRQAPSTAIFLDRAGESISWLQPFHTDNRTKKLLQAGGFVVLSSLTTGLESYILGFHSGFPLVFLFAGGKRLQEAFIVEKDTIQKRFLTTGTQFDSNDRTQGDSRLFGLLGHRDPRTLMGKLYSANNRKRHNENLELERLKEWAVSHGATVFTLTEAQETGLIDQHDIDTILDTKNLKELQKLETYQSLTAMEREIDNAHACEPTQVGDNFFHNSERVLYPTKYAPLTKVVVDDASSESSSGSSSGSGTGKRLVGQQPGAPWNINPLKGNPRLPAALPNESL